MYRTIVWFDFNRSLIAAQRVIKSIQMEEAIANPAPLPCVLWHNGSAVLVGGPRFAMPTELFKNAAHQDPGPQIVRPTLPRTLKKMKAPIKAPRLTQSTPPLRKPAMNRLLASEPHSNATRPPSKSPPSAITRPLPSQP